MSLIKALMTGSFVFLGGVLTLLAWFMVSPVTASTVSARLVQGCLVSNTTMFAAVADSARFGQQWRGLEHCRCISGEIIGNIGPDRAGRLADAMRLQVTATLKSMISGQGIRAARSTPYVADAARLIFAAGRANGVCERQDRLKSS